MSVERPRFQPPSPAEIARRKALVAQILARSEQRRITPSTTVDLVRQERAERQKRHERWTR